MPNHLASLSCGGSSGATVLVQDNFNTAAAGTVLPSETPAVGPSPVTVTGMSDLKIVAGSKAGPNAAATSCADVYLTTQSDVTVTVNNITFDPADDAGIIGRYQDASNFWYINYDRNLGDFLITEKGGGSNVVRASASVTISSDKLTAQFSGTSISGSMQAAGANLSYTSSDFQTAKSFGIGCGVTEGASASDETFSGFKVTNP